MPRIPLDKRPISKARRKLASAEADILQSGRRLADARASVTVLSLKGTEDSRIDLAKKRVVEAEKSHQASMMLLEQRRKVLRDKSNQIVAAVTDPKDLVATMDGRRPVLLFPVRLETRFTGSTLRIRVFPDQIHLDTHEPELTAAEVEDGKRYWHDRWAGDQSSDPWNQLTALHDPPRARWLVDQLMPKNVDELGRGEPDFPKRALKAEDWTRAGQARLLPDRWVAIGRRKGKVLFTKWGSAIPDSLAVTPTPDSLEDLNQPTDPSADLLFDDLMRWLVDYDEAVSVGMGITITPADLTGRTNLRSGLDELIVLGVDWTLTPLAGANALEAHFESQRYTGPFGFIPPGTATNNTTDDRSGFVSEEVQRGLLDPMRTTEVTDASASRTLAKSLGLDLTAFDGVAHGERRDSETAAALHNVLWEATLGHFLEDLCAPLVDEQTADAVRIHVARWLRPGGPLGTLLVGSQPYGLLPCVPLQHYKASDPLEQSFLNLGQRAGLTWAAATTRVPRMGRSGDPDDDLLELLQRSPLAEVARFRRVWGPEVEANSTGFENHFFSQMSVKGWLRNHLELTDSPDLFRMTADPKDHRLRVPWVGKLPDDAPSTLPYLATIAQLTQSPGGREELQSQGADSLLKAFVAHSAVEEIDHAVALAVLPFRVDAAAGEIRSRGPDQPRFLYETRIPTAEFVGVERTTPATPMDAVSVSTRRQVADLVVPKLTGRARLADFVVSNLPRTTGSSLANFVRDLQFLSERPAKDVERAFRGFLDATSHRLDAWTTSLATRRLDAVRHTQPRGVHLGGFGWVQDLRPDTRPDSLGYIHAPSIPHATTAAILRSGHLAHRDGEHEALDIDLSSDRVKLALPVLEGVAEGQTLAALLGYRFERLLRETNLELARFILPFRRLAPLRGPEDTPTSGAIEAVAERDVVDGVRLLELWEKESEALFAKLGGATANRRGGTPTRQESNQLAGVLNVTASIYDAVSDLMVAEAVHQTALGNSVRAGAALAALDKQERPPFPEVIRTPRTGTDYTQRVAIVLPSNPPPTGWPTDARSGVAPRLNAWVASLLPDPARVRILARLQNSVGASFIAVTPADLGLSPISLVVAVGAGGNVLTRDPGERASRRASHRTELSKARTLELQIPQEPGRPGHELDEVTQLEEWVAVALAKKAKIGIGQHLEDTLAILDQDPPDAPDDVGLGGLRTLLKWIHTLIVEARPASAEDLAAPSAEATSGYHLSDLDQRADQAEAHLLSAQLRTKTALARDNSSRATLVSALKAAAGVGVSDAVPRHVVAESPSEVRSVLRAQLKGADESLTKTRALVNALSSEFGRVASPTEEEVFEYHRARIRAVFGDVFPVLPLFRVDHVPGLPSAIAASLADASLTDGDGLAVRAWIDRLSPVEPGVDRLAKTITAAELLGSPGSGPDSMAIMQLPYAQGDRWLALPFPESGPSQAEVACALHAPLGINPNSFIAGMVCAQWNERVPASEETTGLSFHYDAPAARPPQVVLLAVPAATRGHKWSLDALVDTVTETMELAKARGVTTKELPLMGAVLPATYLPDNLSKHQPSVNLIEMAVKGFAQFEHSAVLGK